MQMSTDMQTNVQKAKDLATKLIAVEQRAGELQKKYDESKRGYFKLREDREKLKSELEKIKGVEVEGNQTQNQQQISTTETGNLGLSKSNSLASMDVQ